jgi:putative phosphoribosyl transferase
VVSTVSDYPTALFHDRVDAGKKLADSVQKLALGDAVVLAIPSGGVPVGAEVAKALGAPLDLMIARKVQFPWSTEAGFGAVVSDGTVYIGPYGATLPQSVVQAQIEKAKRQVQHRVQEFLSDRPPLDVAGKDVILVDDGLATGSTMLAAVRSLRRRNPRKVIMAVPTASGTAVQLLKPHVDELVALYVHPAHLPFAVASSYENWHDLTDDEVKRCLAQVAQAPSPARNEKLGSPAD